MIPSDRFGSCRSNSCTISTSVRLKSRMAFMASVTVSRVMQLITIRTFGFLSRRSRMISFIFPEDPPIKACVGTGKFHHRFPGAVPARSPDCLWQISACFLQKSKGIFLFLNGIDLSFQARSAISTETEPVPAPHIIADRILLKTKLGQKPYAPLPLS